MKGFFQTHGTWGERCVVWRTETELHTILFLRPNQRCSWHEHRHAWNMFFCIGKGHLGVKTDLDKENPQTTKIGPKQTFTVPPGVKHEFITYELPTVIYEVAYVQYDENDIVRERLGGPLEDGRNE